MLVGDVKSSSEYALAKIWLLIFNVFRADCSFKDTSNAATSSKLESSISDPLEERDVNQRHGYDDRRVFDFADSGSDINEE